MKIILFFALCLLMVNCTDNTAIETELAATKSALAIAEAKLTTSSTITGLVHTTYFTMKPDLTEAEQKAFLEGLESLKNIKEVQSIIIEKRLNVGDEVRALTQFDIIMQLMFANEADLKNYDKNEEHNKLRKTLGKYLAGPPATFDFMVD